MGCLDDAAVGLMSCLGRLGRRQVLIGVHSSVIEEALAGLFVVIEDAACVRNGSMLLKKLPKKCCGIKLRNNRIRQADPLNQHCAFEADIESIFPSEAAKILFQQHRSYPERLMESICIPVHPRDRTLVGVLRLVRVGTGAVVKPLPCTR